MDVLRPMTCEDVNRDEIVEKYVTGQLSEDTRESFEQHYFECARCFGLLQVYRDMQSELARTRHLVATADQPRWLSRWTWLPAVAVLVLGVSVTLTVLRSPPVPPAQLAAPAVPTSPPPVAPAPPALGDLAPIEPPPYVPTRLRGDADKATRGFLKAMEQYQRRDFSQAAAGLRDASTLDPEAPHILFFLGASLWLSGQRDAAIEALTKTIRLGESPYLEDAHLLRAKAYLHEGDVGAATQALERTIQLRGEREAEARSLLEKVRARTK